MKEKLPPLVSVHLITFNQIAFIRGTLDSIVTQDYPNFEIVVADDGSTDGTDAIILEYANRFPTLIRPIVGGPNLGVTGNCNRALQYCQGKYIAFIGGDDLFLPGKISKQVEWLEANEKRVLCAHQVEVFYDDGSPSHLMAGKLYSGTGPRRWIRDGHLFGTVSIMVRADAMPHNGFDANFPIVSDGFFFIEMLMRGGQYGCVDGVYARYRRHGNNITSQWDRCSVDLSKVFDTVADRYPAFRRDAEIGRARVLLYGNAMRYMRIGESRKASEFFLRTLRAHPLWYKPWVRLVQNALLRFKRDVP